MTVGLAPGHAQQPTGRRTCSEGAGDAPRPPVCGFCSGGAVLPRVAPRVPRRLQLLGAFPLPVRPGVCDSIWSALQCVSSGNARGAAATCEQPRRPRSEPCAGAAPAPPGSPSGLGDCGCWDRRAWEVEPVLGEQRAGWLSPPLAGKPAKGQVTAEGNLGENPWKSVRRVALRHVAAVRPAPFCGPSSQGPLRAFPLQPHCPGGTAAATCCHVPT